MRLANTAVTFTVVTLAAATARAEPPPPHAPLAEPAPARPTTTTRYGAQIIVAEFAGISVAGIGVAIGEDTGGLIGAGAWLLGVPAVHVAHGAPGRAVAAFALRQGLLWSGALIGGALPCSPVTEHRNCHLGRALGGAMIGYGAAVVIDAVFLARTTRAAPSTTPRWSPTFAATTDGASVGVAGAF